MNKRYLLVIAIVLVAMSVSAQDWSAAPTYGEVELESGFLPDPYVIELDAGGSVDLSKIGYMGYVNDAPDYDLYYEAGDFPLTIKVDSNADTVLLINDPDGNWLYNDDSDGLNPAITLRKAKSGLYDIWVGTVYSGDGFPSAELIFTEMD